MPSVPSATENPVNGPVCPHASKLLHANGVDKVTDAEDTDKTIELSTKNAAAERKWIRPDLPSRCTWSLGASKDDSPHFHVPK